MNQIDELLKELNWQTTDYVKELLLNDNYSHLKIKELLIQIFEKEKLFKKNRREYLKIRTGGFPREKTIAQFDFSFQPSINKNRIDDLLTLKFIDEKQNVIFIGTPGVGKTHLATAIGMEAAKTKQSVYFIECNRLLSNLKEAKQKNMLSQRLKHYAKYKLLIIDEMGFLPMDQETANILFQLISLRYMRNSTIITTNKDFPEWGRMFNDQMIADAILDRLLHFSNIFSISGKSYRTYQAMERMKKSKI